MNDLNNTKNQIAGMFTRAAPTYDQVGFKSFYHFGKKMVEFIDIPRNAKILDVASGRGAILFSAIKKVGPQGLVIGIDFAEGMVHETTKEINKYGFTNAKIIQMDAENLEFQDNTFDVALYGFCIFLFPHYKDALAESYRILKPNGRIGFSTFCRSTFGQHKWLSDLFEKYLPQENEKDDDGEEEQEGSVFDTITGMSKILNQAGYKEVYNKVEEEDFVCENAEELWKYLWSTGYRRRMESINPENLEPFKEDIISNFPKYSAKDGLHWKIKALFTFGRK